MTQEFRCSTASADIEEPLAGTASTVRAFLLVEAAGPWGTDVVRDSRLPEEVKQRLATLEPAHRVRPLLIRREGRPTGGPTRVFAAYVHTDRPWTETTELDDVHDLLDLDVTGVGDGRSPGLTPYDEQLLLVCTHGKHDACCAERGRPLYAAIREAAPENAWEVSHIGGDRFAGNVLVLPHGLYYGRMEPAHAEDFTRGHLAGQLDLERLRGRSSYPFSVQAAEVYLRRHLGRTTIAPMPLTHHTRHGAETTAVFADAGDRWEVRVHTELGRPRRLTCRATSPSVGMTHTLVEIRALPPG